jgi:hypothetical protein
MKIILIFTYLLFIQSNNLQSIYQFKEGPTRFFENSRLEVKNGLNIYFYLYRNNQLF